MQLGGNPVWVDLKGAEHRELEIVLLQDLLDLDVVLARAAIHPCLLDDAIKELYS
jgi:hypothetical protein